jgi:hypothetical protein
MRPDTHEIYARRRSRNVGLGLVLAALVALTFGVTLVKLGTGQGMEGLDHQVRSTLLPEAKKGVE